MTSLGSLYCLAVLERLHAAASLFERSGIVGALLGLHIDATWPFLSASQPPNPRPVLPGLCERAGRL
jgi:hypothetical protein